MPAMRLDAVLSCTFQMATGAAFIFLNKWIMGALEFPYPTVLSFVGFLGSTVITTALVWLRVFRVRDEVAFWGPIGAKVLLLSLFVSLSVVTGTEAYLFLSVSFIQMLKATTPVLTMGLLVALSMLWPTRDLLLATTLIVSGAIVSCFGELSLSAVGLAIMLVSCASEAARCVSTQALLQNSRLSLIESMYMISPFCALSTLVAGFFLEPDAFGQRGTTIVRASPGVFLVAASLGFVQHVCTLWVVQATNALTLKLLGPLRSIIVVGISVLCLGETLTRVKALGYAVSMVGLLWYNVQQMRGSHGGGGGGGAAAGSPRGSYVPVGKAGTRQGGTRSDTAEELITFKKEVGSRLFHDEPAVDDASESELP